METEINGKEMGERIEGLMREFLGKNTDFSLGDYLKNHKISSLNELNHTQRKKLAEDLVEKIIRPSTSSGKTSLAMVELMSILNVDIEPWKMTTNYCPSPREYLLAKEMNDDFNKLKHYATTKQMVRYNLNTSADWDVNTKHEIVNSIISDTFGQIPKMTLTYAHQLFNYHPVELVVSKNLTTYMPPEEAERSAQVLTQLIKMIFKIDPEREINRGINEKALSNKITNYFNDMNQVLIRRFRNQYDIDSMSTMSDEQKNKVIHGIMSHYFGPMSEKYISREYGKFGFDDSTGEDAIDKARLTNAVIFDCLQASMVKEDAKKAQDEIKKLIDI